MSEREAPANSVGVTTRRQKVPSGSLLGWACSDFTRRSGIRRSGFVTPSYSCRRIRRNGRSAGTASASLAGAARTQEAIRCNTGGTGPVSPGTHDTLLQGFTGITIQLRAIQRVLSRRPNEDAAALETVLTSADSCIARSLRNAIGTCAPRMDSKAETLPRRWSEPQNGDGRNGDPSGVQGAGRQASFVRIIEIAALRIAREAVVNAVKHAGATRVEVVVTFAGSALELRIRDDGTGIQPGNTGEEHRGQAPRAHRYAQASRAHRGNVGDGAGERGNDRGRYTSAVSRLQSYRLRYAE